MERDEWWWVIFSLILIWCNVEIVDWFFVWFVSGMFIMIVVVRILNFMLKGSKNNFLRKNWFFLCIRLMYEEFECFVRCVRFDFVIIILFSIVVFN